MTHSSALLLIPWLGVMQAAPGASSQARATLSLATRGETAYERMPIPLGVVVTNVTDQPLETGFTLTPIQHEYVRVLYRRIPEGFSVLSYSAAWDDSIACHPPAAETFSLKPHASDTFWFSLAVDPGRGAFIFDRPGDYEIKLVRLVSRGHTGAREAIAMEPLRIHVEPAPPSEADALVDWDVDLATFAQDDGGSGGPHYRREVPRALKFMDRHPMSLYSRLLRQRTFDSLHRMRREGEPLTEYEQDAFERLKVSMREEAQREAQQR